MNIFIANLSKEATEDDLLKLFSEYGHVQSVKIIRDMFTQESKRYGFIDMPGTTEAEAAIEKLNASEFMGKKLSVSPAHSRAYRRGRDNSGSGNISGNR